jgi:hypothetical protein
MPIKTRDLLARSWQSQANLSLFLLLLVLTAFVIPSVGFEKNGLPYDRVAASVVQSVHRARLNEFSATSLVVIVAITIPWAT